MKTTHRIQYFAFVVFTSFSLLISSCKKEKIADPAPIANGEIFLHLHTNVDTNEVNAYNDIYTTSSGRKIAVSMAQLYISNIQLVKIDGSTIDVSDKKVLKLMEVEAYALGSVPAGNYRSIKFNVGLDNHTNALLPEPGDSTFYRSEMWFGNTVQPWNGYVFANFQGLIDTTTSANSPISQMQSFSYKIGTSANLKSVTMPAQNFTITPNLRQYIHIVVDYNKLFNGIQINQSVNLHINTLTENTTSAATQISNNIPLMFEYAI